MTEDTQSVPEETKPQPKTLETLTQEYQQTCAFVGDASYRLKLLSSDIEQAYSKLYTLNQEAAKLKESQVSTQTLPPVSA